MAVHNMTTPAPTAGLPSYLDVPADVRDRVNRLVDSAPPLSGDVIARLVALLASGDES